MKFKTDFILECPTTLGKKIWYLRQKKEITLKEVSDAIGVTQPYISEIENDNKQNISLNILRKICTLYGVSLSELFDGVK